MIHITTGNHLDVVYDYVNDKKVLIGLHPWAGNIQGDIIKLRDPKGLISVLEQVLEEIEKQ